MEAINYTKDRNQQRLDVASDLAGRNSKIFGVCISGFMVLCLYHEDYRMLGFLTLFMLAALANKVLNKLLTEKQGLVVLHVINIGALLAFQYLLSPEASAGTIVIFAITTMWGARTLIEFAVVSGILFIGKCAMISIGIPQGIYTPVPTEQFLAVAFCASTLGAYLSTKHILEATHRTQLQLAAASESLEAEETQLEQISLETKMINEKVEYQNDQLSEQLNRVQVLHEKLKLKRAGEQDLVKAIHHDLREPLRSIVSFTQLIRRKLREKNHEVSVKEYLTFAENGGRRMSIMLQDILRYAQNDRKACGLAPVDLNLLVKDVQANLGDQLQRTEAKVSWSNLPVIKGYRTRLIQLFQNIISNAIKFSRPGVVPKVEIGMCDDVKSGEICLFFRDNGIGVDVSQIDKVFGLFNRAHVSDDYEGSGVGLALCKRIAIAHQGELSLTSEVGFGTTFFLTLPKHLLCDRLDIDVITSPQFEAVDSKIEA